MQASGRKQTSNPRKRPDPLLVLDCRSTRTQQTTLSIFLPVYVPAFAAITSAVNGLTTNSLGGLPVREAGRQVR
jgi:hypothetical protein